MNIISKYIPSFFEADKPPAPKGPYTLTEEGYKSYNLGVLTLTQAEVALADSEMIVKNANSRATLLKVGSWIAAGAVMIAALALAKVAAPLFVGMLAKTSTFAAHPILARLSVHVLSRGVAILGGLDMAKNVMKKTANQIEPLERKAAHYKTQSYDLKLQVAKLLDQ